RSVRSAIHSPAYCCSHLRAAKVWLWSPRTRFGDHNHTFALWTLGSVPGGRLLPRRGGFLRGIATALGAQRGTLHSRTAGDLALGISLDLGQGGPPGKQRIAGGVHGPHGGAVPSGC